LSEDAIAASVAALRSNPDLVPLLRLRVVESNVANQLVYEGISTRRCATS
jgi:hypothetical protein